MEPIEIWFRKRKEESEMKKVVEERIERMKPLAKEKGFSLEYGEKIENHCVLSGIVIQNLKENICPCVYYEKNWDALSDIELLEKLIQFTKKIPKINIEVIFDKKYFSEHVLPIILGLENEEMIQRAGLVYRKTENFLILFYIEVERNGIIKINSNYLQKMCFTEDEMIKFAFKNLEENLTIETIGDLISEIDKEADIPRVYVVSTKYRQYGAPVILLPKTYEILSKYLGDKFIILPSSIHECLAIEYDEDWLEEYAEMVKTVNRNEVDEVDKLSDHIYLCDKTGISLLK